MRYMLICQNCGQRHFTDGSDIDGLVEVKSAPLPKHANGKNKDAHPLPKKFKCYTCGHLFKTVKLAEMNKKKPIIDEKKEPPDIPDDESYLKQWENEALKSVRKKTLPPQI